MTTRVHEYMATVLKISKYNAHKPNKAMFWYRKFEIINTSNDYNDKLVTIK